MRSGAQDGGTCIQDIMESFLYSEKKSLFNVSGNNQENIVSSVDF